ncbi:uncharacterized ferritin-like protein (DUF455 family) [Parvibaculum indicum]|uniref:ferritin-like domain-containing protein n=1 Tax=Parvibaculum indicum TaxID=562969 RepID=UPI00141E62B5|nr:ferritin-like domain-containing protein [Parvibaculum indicum]NIJ42627.1 uncharacterized ferritin-like protein (DUF455 family) [Parvibaculum indicum]
MTIRAFPSLVHAACAVLATREANAKAALAREAAAAWKSGTLALLPAAGEAPAPPLRPGRPDAPPLLPPSEMPRRSFKGRRGRFALLHAVAHIELNAIDLAFDIVARFAGQDLPRAFFDDWISVGNDEARHFALLQARLAAMGGRYGDLPAHDGLWEAAEETRADLMARLAVVPMVLEARGLDVTPGMIDRLEAAQDTESAAALRIIYEEEKRHVAAGAAWFRHLCEKEGRDPETAFHETVRRHFRGALKPPFNDAARLEAGMPSSFYEPLAQILRDEAAK